MPRKPAPPGSIPPKANTKVEKDLLRRARAVADYEGKELYELLDAILRPEIDQRYRLMIRAEAEAIEEEQGADATARGSGVSSGAGRGRKGHPA